MADNAMTNMMTDLGAFFFATSNPSEKIAAAILEITQWRHLADTLQRAKNESPTRQIKERAARLGAWINEGETRNDPFVQEVKKLSFKELIYFAKSYHVKIRSSFKAAHLNTFMKAHGLTHIDTQALAFVETAAKRIGGSFLDIYNAAKLFGNALDNTICSGTTASSPGLYLTTLPLFTKSAVIPLFHKDAIKMMETDKSWGNGTLACNVKMHLYTGVAEMLIDVPIGVDPRKIKIFPTNDVWGRIHYEKRDTIVLITDDARIRHGLASTSLGFQRTS